MLSLSPRRTVAILALVALFCLPSAVLAQPAAHTPEVRVRREVRAGQGMLAQLRDLFQHLWGAEGMMIDPNGSPSATNPIPNNPSSDAGMLIDPDGSH